ncbi:hypothetical protein TREMEDRAFT_65851 [Tremella mesenterica DSM 1558]|uniref:uncharacterized protein n=1 Tax=Tremella mesenterica (strain ATCC 24925 / CBS 8224 / DSM 1558 / NBRC 9311 / NRRL Y-6157 / RJB 2259-6 / UBC 559-6) TaxID=578456 RepID=UPI00032D0FF9|nr:uncharacterized protein TREMEDRAFT_65851 [Tremella mesenterica DSM 1558]EIW66240.1 hypothetical protein TREMEDRAFT_65851 [Tremella mesenterica DSM 1558]
MTRVQLPARLEERVLGVSVKLAEGWWILLAEKIAEVLQRSLIVVSSERLIEIATPTSRYIAIRENPPDRVTSPKLHPFRCLRPPVWVRHRHRRDKLAEVRRPLVHREKCTTAVTVSRIALTDDPCEPRRSKKIRWNQRDELREVRVGTGKQWKRMRGEPWRSLVRRWDNILGGRVAVGNQHKEMSSFHLYPLTLLVPSLIPFHLWDPQLNLNEPRGLEETLEARGTLEKKGHSQ